MTDTRPPNADPDTYAELGLMPPVMDDPHPFDAARPACDPYAVEWDLYSNERVVELEGIIRDLQRQLDVLRLRDANVRELEQQRAKLEARVKTLEPLQDGMAEMRGEVSRALADVGLRKTGQGLLADVRALAAHAKTASENHRLYTREQDRVKGLTKGQERLAAEVEFLRGVLADNGVHVVDAEQFRTDYWRQNARRAQPLPPTG